MNEYIEEALCQDFIRPSISPATSSYRGQKGRRLDALYWLLRSQCSDCQVLLPFSPASDRR